MSIEWFSKPAALVTFVAYDEITDGYAVIQDPRLAEYAGAHWLESVSRFVSPGGGFSLDPG